jgi:hypothetical protein
MECGTVDVHELRIRDVKGQARVLQCVVKPYF